MELWLGPVPVRGLADPMDVCELVGEFVTSMESDEDRSTHQVSTRRLVARGESRRLEGSLRAAD
jgi:hypothetical protein